MEFVIDEQRKQTLDDEFDAFTMLAQGNYVSLYDVKGKLTRYSPGAVELFNLPGEYIPDGAYDWADYIHPEDRKHYLEVMERLIGGGIRSYDITYRVRTRSGSYVSFRFIGAVIRAADGEPSLVGGMMINQGLLDNTDSVTVLRNKIGFFEDMPALMRSEEKVVTLLLGLNGMSTINEVRGYGFGNRVLQQVSWVIQESIAGRGSVYRMEDVTFAVVSSQMSEQEMAALYDAIRVKLQRGVRVDGILSRLSTNGGLIMTRGLLMDAGTIHSCLTYAYRISREQKHGDLVDFNGTANASAREALDIINHIRDCVLENCEGFSLKYQPIVDAATERPVGAEALLRWTNEAYSEVGPSEFLPILERDYVYEELTSWILKRAMRDGMRFLEKDPDFVLSFNVSLPQLQDEYFTDELLQTMSQTGFPARRLMLELTKGCRLIEPERLRRITALLREEGVRIVIDDFGSGLDSCAFLKALAPDFVKPDLRYVQALEQTDADRATLEGLVRVAAAHGAVTLVKGVETPAARDILRSRPVTRLQGNLFARPLDAEAFIEAYY